MLTKDNVADEHHKLVEAIYAYDYYVKAFEYVQSSFDLNLDNPEHICAFGITFGLLFQTILELDETHFIKFVIWLKADI